MAPDLHSELLSSFARPVEEEIGACNLEGSSSKWSLPVALTVFTGYFPA